MNALPQYRPAMPFGNKNFVLEDLFSSVLSQFIKYHHFKNLNFNNLGISQSLKFRIFMGKNSSNSRKLNFTPNTLGCYGLKPTTAQRCHSETENFALEDLFCSV